jgi:hypothetical protein
VPAPATPPRNLFDSVHVSTSPISGVVVTMLSASWLSGKVRSPAAYAASAVHYQEPYCQADHSGPSATKWLIELMAALANVTQRVRL